MRIMKIMKIIEIRMRNNKIKNILKQINVGIMETTKNLRHLYDTYKNQNENH